MMGCMGGKESDDDMPLCALAELAPLTKLKSCTQNKDETFTEHCSTLFL